MNVSVALASFLTLTFAPAWARPALLQRLMFRHAVEMAARDPALVARFGGICAENLATYHLSTLGVPC